MLKLIKTIYNAGRQAGAHEAELKFRKDEAELKEEIRILKTIIIENEGALDLNEIEEFNEI